MQSLLRMGRIRAAATPISMRTRAELIYTPMVTYINNPQGRRRAGRSQPRESEHRNADRKLHNVA